MRTRVADHISSLIDEVKRVESESEGSYLSFGRLLASISSEMDLSSRNAKASLEGFSSTLGGRSASSLHSIADFARDSSAFFATIHDRDVAFLARINESIDRLSSLEDVIGRVRLDSEEMEIISLNAMTVALKSGNAGKAFSVITDELKRLSTRTIALTETITTRGRELMDCFSGLRDSLGELDGFQKAFFGRLDTALNQGFVSVESRIRGSVTVFGGLLDEAMGVREPVQAIMQSVQLQDIIRQSLQHVTISLVEAMKAAEDAGRREEEAALAGGQGDPEAGVTLLEAENEFVDTSMDEDLAFISAIMKLTDALIEDVVERLDASGSSFGGSLASVESIVGGVEQKRLAQVLSHGDRTARDSGSDADDDSGAGGAGYSQGSARYLELKKQVVLTARRLSEQVKGLDESFRGLAGLLSRFQNIVIASRIEVAKNRALSGVTNTVQGMVQLTERLGTDVGEAMDTTKTFIKVAYGAIIEYAGMEAARRDIGMDRDSGSSSAAFEAAALENEKRPRTPREAPANERTRPRHSHPDQACEQWPHRCRDGLP